MRERWLKYISFGGFITIITLLIAATILEKFKGSSFVLDNIYHSPYFIILWGTSAMSAILYIIKAARRPSLLLLHVSLIAILFGALMSFITAEHGEMTIAADTPPSSMFVDNAGELRKLPFRITLVGTETLCDEESNPVDYIVRASIYYDGKEEQLSASMNKPIKKVGYTLCIKAHAPDAVSLLVSHDVLGKPITFLGYTMSVLSFLLLFADRGTLFRAMLRRKNKKKRTTPAANKILSIISALLLIAIGIAGIVRWYNTSLFPVTNGNEAMIFISWCGFIITLCLRREGNASLPSMFFLSLASLLVALLTRDDSSNVMPILRTPLLSLHVTCMILSYTLLGFLAINACIAIFSKKNDKSEIKTVQLATLGRIMLYPATLLLSAGIFIGAVWAEISWGRYWGWDPKEVWALITLLLCSLPFHTKSMPIFSKNINFHYFCLILFLAMLFTYLGVNYLLGGIHAYL